LTAASLAAVTETTREPAAAAWRPGLPRRAMAAVLALALLGVALALALRGGSHHPAAAARGAAGEAAHARRAPAPSSAPAVGTGPATGRRVSIAPVAAPQGSSSFPAPAG